MIGAAHIVRETVQRELNHTIERAPRTACSLRADHPGGGEDAEGVDGERAPERELTFSARSIQSVAEMRAHAVRHRSQDVALERRGRGIPESPGTRAMPTCSPS
jgi:hypothetical protein